MIYTRIAMPPGTLDKSPGALARFKRLGIGMRFVYEDGQTRIVCEVAGVERGKNGKGDRLWFRFRNSRYGSWIEEKDMQYVTPLP